MFDTERICLGCMNDNGGEKICPICGYDSNNANPNNSLPTRFVIKNRYIVGRAFKVNGQGIFYMGWDNAQDAVVTINEYFPLGAANRNPDKTVSIEKGAEFTFNEGLLEFTEINKNIIEADLPALMPVVDVFEENGTVYSITKTVQGITLESFLEKNGGTLKWEQARALFLPLIDTVKSMNDRGIIHGGISDKTIIVGRDGKLRITDYFIKKLRQADSELEEEIYHGYAAVEQYNSVDLHIDTYTDVYGICATIFRVLIGNVPLDALKRLENDSMTIPARFAEELPRHVLSALANGLQVLPKNRTKDIEALKDELVYGESAVVVSKAPITQKTAPKPTSSNKKSAKYAIISAVCTVVVLLGIAAGLIFGVFRDEIFPPEQTPTNNDSSSIDAPDVDKIGDVDEGSELAPKTYKVPDFKGKYYSKIESEEDNKVFVFIIKEKDFSDYPKGTVISQSVTAGTEVVKETKIELVISLGPKEVEMPNLFGMTEDEAKMELLKKGFLYTNINVEEMYDETEDAKEVIKQEPEYKKKVSTDIAVTIYINSYTDD